MDGWLLPIGFGNLGAGARGWLVVAALVCALLWPPLVLAFLFALILAVAAASGPHLPVPVAARRQRHHARQTALRGPPAR